METTMTTEPRFVVTDEWLDRFRPTRGSSWTQQMIAVLDPEAWPNGRRAPVAGWRDRVRGRVISDAQRVAFERQVRESVRHDIAWHAEALEAAQQRLAALNGPVPTLQPDIVGWATWPTVPRTM